MKVEAYDRAAKKVVQVRTDTKDEECDLLTKTERLLCAICVFLKPELEHPDYPQTWWFMPKRNTLRYRMLRGLCQWLTGHRLSKTEHGYGGGTTEDAHCRWCDKLFNVPVGDFYNTWGHLVGTEGCSLDLPHP